MLNAIEFPNFVYDDVSILRALDRVEKGVPLWLGQYALAEQHGESVFLARDPLGCNKLFFGQTKDKSWVVTSRIKRALESGVSMDGLGSCPPGKVVRLDSAGPIVVGGDDLSSRKPADAWGWEAFSLSVRQRLQSALRTLAANHPSALFVVCLSGGLDSSVVAKLASENLDQVYAATFSYISRSDLEAYDTGQSLASLPSLSDDFRHAEKVAGMLGIPMLPVLREQEDVAAVIQQALLIGQDWRDFNVHCAVVNAFLAQDISVVFPDREVIVITGDLMNEYVCDYREEVVDGHIYYPQPKVPLIKRRRFFVRGLDAGDREIGVFNAYGLPVIQLFSVVADLYMDVPEHILEQKDSKERLNGSLLIEDILDVVNKAKQRAQVGGKDMGTLGVFHRLGIDQAELARLWVAQLPVRMVGNAPHDIIQVGRYRFLPRNI